MKSEFETLITNIKKKYEKMKDGTISKSDFIAHLRTLGRWEEEPMDYPLKKNIKFPEYVHVAFAVCHPECGVEEFIVEGSTQECQSDGSLMFRLKTRKYKLCKEK